MIKLLLFVSLLSLSATASVSEPGQSTPTRGHRINNLKVLSSSIDDVTTAENILKSFSKPGMSDADKSKALWKAAVRYRHQTSPPNEFLAEDWEAHDPVKIFNVYGYCMCCCCSAILEGLNRLDGREAHGRILNGHSVPEVQYDGGWHMFDCSLINYFPKADGAVAAVDEVTKAVQDWYSENPTFRNNGDKLAEIMRADGWTGYKKGPKLLADNPFYDLGWWPAKTHGWSATMSEYDRKSETYEYGYQLGHRALFSLRPGESFVREAGNRGLHVNMAADPKWEGLKQKAPDADLVYLKTYLPGYNGGVVGNGYHRYMPDLSNGGLASGAEVYENLQSGSAGPILHVANPSRSGVAVVEMSSPYVYLGGRISVSALRQTATDSVKLSLSTNNGLTYKQIWEASGTGKQSATVDLGARILRRYSYLLKFEIRSATTSGAGLDALSITNDIQHAPRTLPWLVKGKNTITVAADGDARLATRTISCRIGEDAAFDKNETTRTMGVKFENVDVRGGSCWWKGGVGTMTVPIETAGHMSAIRFGAQIRARGERDQIRMLLSFDEGKTWTEAAKMAGPTPGTTRYFRYAAIPAAAKKALLRYELSGNNTVGIFSFRVDADYVDPIAAQGKPSFTVTHRWKENGVEKSKTMPVEALRASYNIETLADPEMVSVTYEMPSGASRR
jgi:hypothetical protein